MAIDLLRVLAFLYVTLFHFAARIGPEFPENSGARAFSDMLLHYSSLGTNTLLVISTLLLCHGLNHGTSPAEALRRRFIRIYPGFLAILSLYLALMIALPQFNRIPDDPMAAIAYVAANLLLLPGVFPITPIVTVAWSLSFIAFGYVGVAACYRVFSLSRQSSNMRLLVWTLLYLAILAGVCFGTVSPSWTYLVLGCILSELVVRFPQRWSLPVLAVGVAAIVSNGGLTASNLGMAFVVLGVQGDGIGRLISHLPVTKMARISYPTFLTHGLVLHAVMLAGPVTNTTADLVALLMGGIALIVATAKVADALALQRMSALAELRIVRSPATT